MNAQGLEGEVLRGSSGTVQLDDELGAGKEGRVYRVKHRNSTVAKIFKPKYRRAKKAKVRAMMESDSEPQDETYKQQGMRSIVWPQDALEHPENGSFMGYTMPERDPVKTKDALVYAMDDLSWEDSLQPERLGTALNLAIIVREIHRQGHAIGDFNHENILVEDAFVSLIDCDAFHIKGKGSVFKGDTFKPRYAPPERRPDSLEDVQKADRFGLAIHLFQMLMEGMHPFLATGEASAKGDWDAMINNNPFPYETDKPEVRPHGEYLDKYRELPNPVRKRFKQCFVDGIYNGDARPTPEEWIATLGNVSDIFTEDSEIYDSSAGVDASDEVSGDSITSTASGSSTDQQTTEPANTVTTEVSSPKGSTSQPSSIFDYLKLGILGFASGIVPENTTGRGRSKQSKVKHSVMTVLKRLLIYAGGLMLLLGTVYVLLSTP